MPGWRWSVPLSAAIASFSPLHAHADLYQFMFLGASEHRIRFDSTALATILAGVPTVLRGIGETGAALDTSSGGTIVRTLMLDELTFAGFPLADRVLQYTRTSAGESSLCMAGTCVALSGALPASWWDAPTPLDLFTSAENVRRPESRIALQPGGHAVLGTQSFHVGAEGGTIEYGWLPTSPMVPFPPAELRVVVTPAPEPGTMALVVAGLLATAGVALRRRSM